MPSPMETELRVHDSPVPTQTVEGWLVSIATAPIDWTGWSSKTGLKVVPPSRERQTPPLAEPTKSSTLPSGVLRASTAAMRPLIVAEPTLRAPSPEMTVLPKAADPADAPPFVDADAGASAPRTGMVDAAAPIAAASRTVVPKRAREARGGRAAAK